MEDLDQVIGKVIRTFGGVEEISAGLREDIVILLYSKDRSVTENHYCSST